MPKRNRVECEICTEEVKKGGACSSCGFSACRDCLQRWCVDKTDEPPSCPQCGVEWNEEEKKRLLTLKFVNTDMRKRRKDVLLAKEYGRMERTLPLATVKRRERERNEAATALYSVQTKMMRQDQKASLERRSLLEEEKEERQILLEEESVLRNNLSVAYKNLREAKEALQYSRVRRCGHISCDGWIDAVSLSCFSCGRLTCSLCDCVKTDGHVCDPDVVETRRVIERDCRPCASCGALSHRIEGCPTMWCPHCHAFWIWDTGQIIRKSTAPHNPDHRAWLRGSSSSSLPPREVGDIPCGGVVEKGTLIPRLQTGVNILLRNDVLSREEKNSLVMLANWFLVVRECVSKAHSVLRPLYPYDTIDSSACLDLRISYLLSEITKERFEAAVETRTKKFSFKREVGRILEAFTFAGVDVLLRLSDSAEDYSVWVRYYTEFQSLKGVFNTACEPLFKSYGMKTPHLTDTWKWSVPGRRSLT